MFDSFVNLVAKEVDEAEQKWPDNRLLHRLAALTGEVGELAEGIVKDKDDTEHLKKEAIQVAAMAYRIYKVLSGTGYYL